MPVDADPGPRSRPRTSFTLARLLIVQLIKPSIENPASGLDVVELPVPKPTAGEVLVRVTLRPINPADIFSIQGVYPGFQPKTLPATPGLEGERWVVIGHWSKALRVR